MSSGDNQFYQTAKGSLSMRLNNLEQLAEAKKQEGVGLEQQIMAYNDEMEHAKANRDTAIFGLSLGGAGAYKVAYGVGSAIGKKVLGRSVQRLQSAVNQYKKQQGETTEEEPTEEEPAAEEIRPADEPFPSGIDPIAPREDFEGFGRQAGTDIETPQIRVTDEPTGGTVEDAYGQEFDPRTLDMSDPTNPREFPQSQEVARDGYGNEFDPSKVDTSSYRNPQPVPEEEVMGAEDVGEQPITKLPPSSQDPRQVIGQETTTEVQPESSFKVLGQEPDPTIKTMGDDIKNSAGTEAEELSDAQQSRLAGILKSNPILSEDNIGTLKTLGADFGELSNQEIDTGARMLMGDSAVEGLSNMLGAAGSVVGSALPVLGLAGDIAGIYFAAKGLQDSKDAVQQEMDDKAKAVQALAQTNIPLNVPKSGATPVLDTSAMRQGGIENF